MALQSHNSLDIVRDIFPNQQKMVANEKEARKRKMENQKFLIAINEKNLEEVNRLVNSVDINFRDQDGWTPLHWAVETGCIDIVKVLLKKYADSEYTNNDQETPLDIATQMNSLDIIKILEDFKKYSVSSFEDHSAISINPVHGYIYQMKLLLLFLHRVISHKYSFQLFRTDRTKADKYDELNFHYVKDEQKLYRVLKAQPDFHKKTIKVNDLLGDDKAVYSLVKYYNSFQACKISDKVLNSIIKDFVICTNIDFDYDDLRNANIELRKVEERDDILDMKGFAKETMKYKFTNSIVEKLKPKLQSTVSDQEVEDFLYHLTFAVNQPNEMELCEILDTEVMEKISLIGTKNAYSKLYRRLVEFLLKRLSSTLLTHEQGVEFFDSLKNLIFCNIEDPISSFTGRLSFLKNMHEFLKKQCQVCISGIGGIGKTELVKKYISDYGHEYDNQVVWINAESYGTAVDSFYQIAFDSLNISMKDKDIKRVISDVYEFFSKRESLFIFDNAEKYKHEEELDNGIDQLMPRLPDNSVKPKIIITTRNPQWPESIKVIKLEALSEEETRELVSKQLNPEDDKAKEVIDKLVKNLQFIPLTLQQAVAYIKMQKEKLSCIELDCVISNYLERYTELTNELLEFNFSDGSDCSYNKSVFATLAITFDTLKHRKNGQDALDILNIISYLHSDNISTELLQIFLPDKDKFSAAIFLLEKYSIVSVQHKAISVHRLVQEVTRIILQQRKEELKVLQNLLSIFNENMLIKKFLDHVISAWSFVSKHSELFAGHIKLSMHIMKNLCCRMRFEEATSISNKMLHQLKLQENNMDALAELLTVKNEIAMCILRTGDHKKAIQELENVQKEHKNILQKICYRSLETQNNMVFALYRSNRADEALNLCYKSIDHCNANNLEDHLQILKLKSNLSFILLKQGDSEKALSMLQEVYDGQKRMFGDFSVSTARTKELVAKHFRSMNRTEDSLKILEEVYRNSKDYFSSDDPDIIETKISIYKELLSLKKEKLGNNHPEVLYVHVAVADALEQQGQSEKALEICNSIFNKVRNPEMFDKNINLHVPIAHVFCKQKKDTDTIAVYKDLLDKQVTMFGKIHPEVLKTRRLMYGSLLALEKYNAALECSLEVLHLAESIHGKNDLLTFDDKIQVGWMYFDRKNYDESLKVFEDLLRHQEAVLGNNHVDCEKTREAIKKILATKQRLMFVAFTEKFEEALRQGVDIPRLVNHKFRETGRSVLHEAVSNDSERMINNLLNNGAEVFVTTINGNTPLHVAVGRGQQNFVKLLLGKANPNTLNDFVDAQNNMKVTALHLAARIGRLDIVKDLLTNRATFCIKDEQGNTPLDSSTSQDVIDFLKIVHEFFEKIKQPGNEVVSKLEKLSSEDFLAVTSTRNEDGHTLSDVASKNIPTSYVATEILEMKKKLKAN